MFPVNVGGQVVLLNKGNGVLGTPSNNYGSKKRSKNLVIIELSVGIITKMNFLFVFRANGKPL